MNLQRAMKKASGIIFVIALMLTAMSGLTSCGTSRSATASRSGGSGQGKSSTHRPAVIPEHLDLSRNMSKPTEALLREADSWIGTSYRYGGNDRDGIDCSAFVMRVYDRALNIKLPRTSRQQQEYCTPIARGDLREGDLVFFKTRGGSEVGHVGIYVGNDCIVHSSSSRGVIISSLSGSYYAENYFSAGRVEKYHAMLGDDRRPSVISPVPAADSNVIASAGTKKKDERRSGIPTQATRTVKVNPVPADGQIPAAPAAEGETSALEELSEFFD